MMRYRLIWSKEALAQLAELWGEADDQATFNSAVQAIDRSLAIMPELQGKEIAEGLRRLKRPPIEVFFAADVDRLIVEIAHVRPARS